MRSLHMLPIFPYGNVRAELVKRSYYWYNYQKLAICVAICHQATFLDIYSRNMKFIGNLKRFSKLSMKVFCYVLCFSKEFAKFVILYLILQFSTFWQMTMFKWHIYILFNKRKNLLGWHFQILPFCFSAIYFIIWLEKIKLHKSMP